MKRIFIMVSLILFTCGIAFAQMQETSLKIEKEKILLPETNDWKFVLDHGTALINGNLLEARTTDGIAHLAKYFTLPEDTKAVVLEYDASLKSSYWGQSTSVSIRIPEEITVSSGMNGCCDNKNKHQIRIRGNNLDFSQNLALNYGDYYHKIIFTQDKVMVILETTKGERIFKKIIQAPGVDPKEAFWAKFKVYTTTDHGVWMKNLAFSVVGDLED